MIFDHFLRVLVGIRPLIAIIAKMFYVPNPFSILRSVGEIIVGVLEVLAFFPVLRWDVIIRVFF